MSTHRDTTLDRILDRVKHGKSEVTIDVEGYAPEQVDQIITAATSRGFHVSGTRRWLLIRDLDMKSNPKICTPCGVVDAEWAANPLPSGAWPWLIGGALVAGAAWLYLSKKKASTWTCRAAMECTHFVKGDDWHAKNKIDNSLAVYSTPPENFKELTLEVTAPDGSYHTYVLDKPAVLPDFTP